MAPDGSLPHSQEPATCPYPQPHQFPLLYRTKGSVIVRGLVKFCFVTW